MDELQHLLEKIESFPLKVAYDALIPLSKVGFCYGKIIHTNEFCVLDATNREVLFSDFTKLKSHVDVMDILKQRIKVLECNKNSKSNLSRGMNDSKQVDKGISSSINHSSVDEPIFEIKEFLDNEHSRKPEKIDVTAQYMSLLKSEALEVASVDCDTELAFIRDLSAEECIPGEFSGSLEDVLNNLEILQDNTENKQKKANISKSGAAILSSKKDKDTNNSGGWSSGFLHKVGRSDSTTETHAQIANIAAHKKDSDKVINETVDRSTKMVHNESEPQKIPETKKQNFTPAFTGAVLERNVANGTGSVRPMSFSGTKVALQHSIAHTKK